MKTSRFALTTFVVGVLATTIGTVRMAYADDPLQPIKDTIRQDRLKGKCGDVRTPNSPPAFDPGFSYNKNLEKIAQAYARAENTVPHHSQPDYDGTIVAFLGTGDPQAKAINQAYRKGAGDALSNCAYKEYGVGFAREEGRSVDFVAIVFGIPTPIYLGGPMVSQADRPGSDYRHFNISPPSGLPFEKRPDLCEEACRNDSMCKAWTYVNPAEQGNPGQCWLKNAVPAAVSCTNCSSGVKPPGNETNINRPGGDFSHFNIGEGQLAACESACTKDSRCVAWTYVRPGVQGPAAQCWLKNTFPPAVVSDCCTSGAAHRPPKLIK